MATYTSTKSGNWSDSTVWGGTPTAADACIIANTQTVTLDTTGCVANSLTINSGGTLVSSTTANSNLTLQLGCANNGTLTLDMSGAASYSTALLMNNSNNATSQGLTNAGTAHFTLKGAAKKSWTTISGAMSAGATSCAVSDATGWRSGDTLIFATTGAYNATPYTDTVSSITVSGTSISWVGGTTNSHADTCPVANFTRNVKVGGASATYKSFVEFASQTSGRTRVIQDVEFVNMPTGTTGYPNNSIRIAGTNYLSAISNCSFHTCSAGVGAYQMSITDLTISDCAFYNAGITGSQPSAMMHTSGNLILNAVNGIASAGPNAIHTRNLISGVSDTAFYTAFKSAPLSNSDIWGCARSSGSVYGSYVVSAFDNCTIGTKFSSACSTAFSAGSYPVDIFVKDSTLQSSNLFNTSNYDFTKLTIINKNDDAGVQEIYSRHSSTVPIIQRNTAIINRSTSSVEMTANYSGAITHTFEVLAKAGETITLKTYVRKNSSYGASTLPSVTISGLGITPVVSTMSGGTGADTWELLTTSATNSGSADGTLTVTFTAQSSTAGAKAFFSGTPVAPFVTRARHYGYVFNETIPTVTVDPYVSASESTASSYTGVTINNTTKEISFASGTADTMQKIYDYSRNWCCADVSRDVPFTRAGTLFSMTSGWTVVDPTITGMTWGGGNVEFTTTGNKDGAFDSCDMTFTTAGTYTFTDATFGGTVELINTSGGAVTVELPTGTSYTNTGPNITVTTPQVYQSVTLTGVTAGSRVQIYDTTNSVELLNSTSAYTWTDTNPAAGSRAIRIRVSYVSGTSAKEFIEANIGTCGTTAPSNAVSYLVSQTDDTTYNANAIDGSAVTGITFTDATVDKMLIDLSGGATDLPSMYAAWVYYASTAPGIATDIDYIRAVDEANYAYSNLVWKNTTSPSVPLKITGGYAWDSATLDPMDLIDTTGGTIFLAPPHVVSKVVTVTGGNVITGDISDIAIPTTSDIATAVWNKALP